MNSENQRKPIHGSPACRGRTKSYKSYMVSSKACKTIPRRTMYRIKKGIIKHIAGASTCKRPMHVPLEADHADRLVRVDFGPKQSMLALCSSNSDEEKLGCSRINEPGDSYNENKNDSNCCSEISNNVELVEEASDNSSRISEGNLPNKKDNLVNHDIADTHLQVDALTKAAVLCMAVKQRHNITDTAVNDILTLINLLCANGHTVPKNKYELKKILGKYTITEIHHLCPNVLCKCYVGVVNQDVNYMICGACSTQFYPKTNVKSGNFFLHLSLIDQLKIILESNSEQELGWVKDKSAYHSLADVCDGKMYKQTLNSQDLSISFSCDGVPVFSSSGFSIWPILCTVNEFSPYQRKKNVMLTSLWFGKNKPEMNAFLKPFVAESQSLAKHGLAYVSNGVQTSIKVFVLIGVCDSVARPLLQYSTQFNGLYGCGFCLHPGEVVSKGKGHTRVYPFQSGIPLRNHADTVEHMRVASIDNKNIVFGIKQTSILLSIPNFNIIEGLIPDYMHSVLLGICRQFMSLWIDSKNHEESYYIGNHINYIDKILLSFKPPLFVSRTPRSVTERKFWKAHEWYAWLLYYSIPTLKGILPDMYVYHWGFLVNGMYILLKNSVTKSEVVTAERILIHFVKNIPSLYGKENSSFNVHLCEHLAASVLNWGPLWAHSAFLYEDYNSELLKSVRSSNGVPLQIIDIFQTKLAMLKLKKAFLPFMSYEEKACMLSVTSIVKSPTKNTVFISDTVQVIGLPKNCPVSDADFLALQKIHIEISRSAPVAYYERVIIKHEMFHCQNYKRVQKRNSYTVILKDGNVFAIKTFLVHNGHCYCIGKYFNKITHSYFSRGLKHFTDSEFLIALQDIGDLSAVHIANISTKVVFLGSPNPAFILVCLPPYNFEILS